MKAWLGRVWLTVGTLGALVPTASCMGGETNWLDETKEPTPTAYFDQCFTDRDCKEGQCHCGTCTVLCNADAACPDGSNSFCSSGESDSYAAQCGAKAEADAGICLPKCGDQKCAGGQACVDGLCTTVQSYSGPLVRAESPPRPLSGGTLALIASGHVAVAADPDADMVHFVDLDTKKLSGSVALEPGDEPGRVVEDAAGLVHVVLRGAGQIATIEPATHSVARRGVCQYPRGIAFDAGTGSLHVACAGGELVTLPAAGGEPTRVLQLDDDLRDVVVVGEKLFVSRFRSAQVFVLGADGLGGRVVLSQIRDGKVKLPAVAWRMISAPDGGVLISHQAHAQADTSEPPIPTEPGGYGDSGAGACTQIVVSVVTKLDDNGHVVWTRPNVPTTLPVDLAIAPTNDLVAIAGAADLNAKLTLMRTETETQSAFRGENSCSQEVSTSFTGAQVMAVAFDPAGRRIVQTREPASVAIYDQDSSFTRDWVSLGTPSRRDTGHELFHLAMRSGLACASCHPEGRDDGHTWRFDGLGQRRTQSLGGKVSATAPFHWSGDMDTFERLVHEVMTERMSGFHLTSAQTTALSGWIDTIPPWQPRPVADVEAVARGQALFESAEVGCAKCHGGASLTNNETVDVGTGAAFQVPSLLGVSRRAPFMHDGCATSLLGRFAKECGGDDHGHTSRLSAADFGDLSKYLESL